MARSRTPGWYSGPDAPGHWRWWDGEAWTEHAVSAYPKGPQEPPEEQGAAAAPDEGTLFDSSLFERTVPEGAVPDSAVPDSSTMPESTVDSTRSASTRSDSTVPDSTVPDSTVPALPPPSRPSPPAGPPPMGGSGQGGARRRPPPQGAAVFARRWLALLVVVVVVVVILAIALRSHPLALYWQGEPLTNSKQVLSQAEESMEQMASADEGVVSAQSRCYYSLPTTSAHDVADFLRCGPVLLPWSSASAPWLTYKLSGRLRSSGEKLFVAARPQPDVTVGLVKGEVLRRPDGTAPPKGSGGLSVPPVPYQPAGWGGALQSAPAGLAAAPVGDLIGGWAHTYRVVAFGELGYLPAGLDQAALRAAIDPPGSAWATQPGPGNVARPLAKLLVPSKGQVFAVAELAVSPGEAAGAVPTQALAAGAAGATGGAGQASLQVLSSGPAVTFPVPGSSGGNFVVAAAVPAGSQPALQVAERGLTQEVSLVGGRLSQAPGILSRGGTDEALSVTGSVQGATINVSDASLVWFAGSDGGTVPPSFDEAYLQILATATPPEASFIPASDFTLQLGGGQVVGGQALPSADRRSIVVGFLVPASFSDGTVVVSAGGRSFDFSVHFA